MNSHLPLFLKQHYIAELEKVTIENLEEKMSLLYNNWIVNEESLKLKTESEVKAGFLEDLFTSVLGYVPINSGESYWNFNPEKSTEVDGKRPDATLGKYSHDGLTNETVAVIEIKGPSISLDLPQKRKNQSYITPVDQAMQYSHKYDNCKWVILSNIYAIRLYKVGRSINYYEEFYLRDLATDVNEFKRFYYFFSKESILGTKTEEVSLKTYRHLNDITEEFYSLYNLTRYEIWNSLIKSNPEHDSNILLEKTQKILDRIIFICFAQVRGLLAGDTLDTFIEDGKKSTSLSIWHHLNILFRYIDQGYKEKNIDKFNGELFKPDEILDYLIIPNEIFDNIEKLISHNYSDVLNVNILGHIFEQSITDIEQLRQGNSSLRKQEGIFYTSEYITQFMVENTLKQWFEELKEKLGYSNLKDWETVNEEYQMSSERKRERTRRINNQIKFWEKYLDSLNEIKIIDPACGSGAFLNKLFEVLAQEKKYADSMIKNLISARTLNDPTIPFEQPVLFDIEKETLNSNLFGVDLNKESVEITKLSLWLNTAVKGKTLTNLNGNIKQGNSLIADKSVAGDVAFNWNTEFKEIIEKGGFDIVLGNPPYVTSRNNKFVKSEKEYFKREYKLQMDKPNTYLLFLEKSLSILKPKGYLGFILPNSWLGIDSAQNIREHLLKNYTISTIVNLYGISFPDANVETVIIIIKNEKPRNDHKVLVQNLDATDLQKGLFNPRSIPQKNWLKNTNYLIDLISSEDDEEIIGKLIKNSKTLINVADPRTGLQAYEVNKGTPKQTIADRENRIFHYNYQFDQNTYKYLAGQDINRYFNTWSGEWLRYGIHLSQPRDFSIFSQPRILIREVTGKYPYLIKATYIEEVFLNNKSILNILYKENGYDLYYILGYLNSKVANFYLQRKAVKSNRTLFPKVTLGDLERLPIPKAHTQQQLKVAKNVKDILVLEDLLQTVKRKFIDFLAIECQLTLTNKIHDLENLNEIEFIKELKKKNKKFSIATDNNDVINHFRIFHEKSKELKMQSLNLQNNINLMFYEIINLTPEQRSIVEYYQI